MENGMPLERHYRINEIAEIWRLSATTVREMFISEPDVFISGSPNYRVLSIPESVVRRVHERFSHRLSQVKVGAARIIRIIRPEKKIIRIHPKKGA